jgi:excisionase family DNA binding protein
MDSYQERAFSRDGTDTHKVDSSEVFRLLLWANERSASLHHHHVCLVAIPDGHETDAGRQRHLTAKAGRGMSQKPETALKTRLIDVDGLAEYVGLSTHTIYTMVSQRRIPFVKVGRLTKFDLTAIDAWINQHTVMPMRTRQL